jgi:hypothetical protein
VSRQPAAGSIGGRTAGPDGALTALEPAGTSRNSSGCGVVIYL